jgi:transposase-like protein
MTYELTPIVPPAREGHRRRFSESDKRTIVEEASRSGASLSSVARRHGIAARVLFRWKQELVEPVFVPVRITDAAVPSAKAEREEDRLS